MTDTALRPEAGTPAAADAVETTIVSHLHPTPSWEVTDHEVPTGREEVWRFTPLKRLRGLLEAAGTGAKLDWTAQLPAGIEFKDISGEEARAFGGRPPGDRIAVQAAANATSAVHLDIPAETELSEPIVIDLSGDSADQVVHGHTVVTVGHHAKATIVLRHTGSATYAALTQILVGDSAELTFVSVADWADDAVHTGQTSFNIGRDAQVKTVSVSLGGDLVRLLETAEYDGPGGSVEQFGLYFVDAGQHIEHRLLVDHNAPKTNSNVDYRGALQGVGAHSVWVGDVIIRPVAEGINTYESNKNLVLTDGCQADSVPNLEIETGEIEGAGHASTTGRFDDEQLFYLRSRGIDETEARRLVVHGFFNDIIRRIGVPDVEAGLLEAIEQELAATEVGAPVTTTSPAPANTQES
ncbi:Fe-S cluster assembly protein SufD [Parenemella sanctibonifatiensis]|uniref:Fe-S cluster assembly protein SufD n=1 Tax=Parenemella sanctibonifatiensis TaxID=2016505 RepID=UPI001E3F7968|nr:Fe-S cluster assembly protein SufD [Parenemella sanctibonifatiensis]